MNICEGKTTLFVRLLGAHKVRSTMYPHQLIHISSGMSVADWAMVCSWNKKSQERRQPQLCSPVPDAYIPLLKSNHLRTAASVLPSLSPTTKQQLLSSATATTPAAPNIRRQPHRKIKTKVSTCSYESLEVFDQDVRATFLQEPSPGAAAAAAAASTGLSDLEKLKHADSSGESQGPAAETGAVGREGATAKGRKEALTAEFVARLEIDRTTVESVIRTRAARNRFNPT